MKAWYALCAILSTLSAAFVLWGASQLYDASLGYNWQEVPGKIVVSEVRSKEMPSWRRQKYASYWPEIQYEYSVGGRTLVGHRVWFTLAGPGREDTQQTVAKYPIGKVVSVFVNPNDPTATVLEKGIWWPLVPLLLAGIVFVFFPILAIYLDLHGGLKRRI